MTLEQFTNDRQHGCLFVRYVGLCSVRLVSKTVLIRVNAFTYCQSPKRREFYIFLVVAHVFSNTVTVVRVYKFYLLIYLLE